MGLQGFCMDNMDNQLQVVLDNSFRIAAHSSCRNILPCCEQWGGGCLDRVKDSLNDCLNGHPDGEGFEQGIGLVCPVESVDPQLPSRVLCLDCTNKLDLRLLDAAGLRARYVALSYCWGQCNTVKTTQETRGSGKISRLTLYLKQ
ncbi:hypothetical protein B0H63DRAFT_75475 [Podospora didyma]|uniref:Uncharacterized protein n=1 Tax=Podospora didyma TaxID=330526 RepID=A0AAE0N2J7_9PEZI|nr:hypothetical protein B0H63DRAFT_75475 [Podospora didyma]